MIEQILDTRVDPTVKERLLEGRVNVIACPHCGYRGMVGTPLMYHDPAKQLAIVYVPMELNMAEAERQRVIGTMTQAVLRSLPEEAPKGYLLQPQTALTMQGLTEQILEADGITREMLDRERRKADLINDLARADAAQQERLIAQNEDLIDLTFLEMLTIVAQNVAQSGDARVGLRLLNLRKRLMETTPAGQELRRREEAAAAATQELQNLGQRVTREDFVDLLLRASEDEYKFEAMAMMARGLLDYGTFQIIAERITSAEDEEVRQRYTWARDRLLEIAAQHQQESEAVIKRAADTLRMLIQSDDIPSAIRSNLSRIDETFMEVLRLNLEEAQRTGNTELAGRLLQVQQEILRLLQESSPPEIRFINDLLSIEDEAEALEALRQRRDEVTEDLIAVLKDLSAQLEEAGNPGIARRVNALTAEAEQLL
ncbi:MAG: hypothetical protein Kow00124_03140 [Anaerolineae bacterium]